MATYEWRRERREWLIVPDAELVAAGLIRGAVWAMEAAGFRTDSMPYGRYTNAEVQIWAGPAVTTGAACRWEYAAFLSVLYDESEVVLFRALPDLLEFFARYGPVYAQLQADGVIQERLLGVLERTFEAWHGHSPLSYCERCDAEETYRQRKRAKARAQRKTEKQTC